MAPARALRRAQQWLCSVTAAELTGFFTAQLPVELTRSTSRMSVELAAEGRGRFGLAADPDERPFADPVYWAPFVLVGA